jgi:hypothetical protein
LGAYTGWLKIQGEAEPIGIQKEGYLWIPKPIQYKNMGKEEFVGLVE